MDWYYDGDLKVMLIHRFIRPGGALGGSGKPDPKRLLVGDVYFYC
jgi:hypothetical protein